MALALFPTDETGTLDDRLIESSSFPLIHHFALFIIFLLLNLSAGEKENVAFKPALTIRVTQNTQLGLRHKNTLTMRMTC